MATQPADSEYSPSPAAMPAIGHGCAHRPGDELHAAEKGQILQALEYGVEDAKRKRDDEGDDDDRQRPLQRRPLRRQEPHDETADERNRRDLPQHQPRGLADDGLHLGVIAIGSSSRDGHVARHELHDPEIHQRQIDEHLRTEQPEPVVVRSEVPQQIRREPEADDDRDDRVDVAEPEPADEAPQAAIHTPHSSSSASRRSAGPIIAPNSAPVIAQNTMPELRVEDRTGQTQDR